MQRRIVRGAGRCRGLGRRAQLRIVALLLSHLLLLLLGVQAGILLLLLLLLAHHLLRHHLRRRAQVRIVRLLLGHLLLLLLLLGVQAGILLLLPLLLLAHHLLRHHLRRRAQVRIVRLLLRHLLLLLLLGVQAGILLRRRRLEREGLHRALHLLELGTLLRGRTMHAGAALLSHLPGNGSGGEDVVLDHVPLLLRLRRRDVVP